MRAMATATGTDWSVQEAQQVWRRCVDETERGGRQPEQTCTCDTAQQFKQVHEATAQAAQTLSFDFK